MPRPHITPAEAAAHLARAREQLVALRQDSEAAADAAPLVNAAGTHLDELFDPARFANREIAPGQAPVIVRNIRDMQADWERANPQILPAVRPLPEPAARRLPGPAGALREPPGEVWSEATGVETHRPGADRATRLAVAAMVERYPLADEQAEELRDAVAVFIEDHFDAGDATLALRTLDGEARDEEDFESIVDSTYLMRTDGQDREVLTLVAAMAFWAGIEHLPKSSRHDARLQFGAALVQGQQVSTQNPKVLVHICAPGQLQLIANHMQWYFADVYTIAPPPPTPHYAAARFVDLIERHAVTHVVPPAKHDLIRREADEALRTFLDNDKTLTRRGFLPVYERRERREALKTLLKENIVGVYGITWTPKTYLHTGPNAVS